MQYVSFGDTDSILRNVIQGLTLTFSVRGIAPLIFKI